MREKMAELLICDAAVNANFWFGGLGKVLILGFFFFLFFLIFFLHLYFGSLFWLSCVAAFFTSVLTKKKQTNKNKNKNKKNRGNGKRGVFGWKQK